MKKNILRRGLFSTALIGCVTLLSTSSTLAQKTTKLTDPEIASVAVTANQIDVNYGKIALKKAQSAEVKHFAESMVKDHESIIKSAVALAGKLGVTPKDNAVTESLLKGEKGTVAKLNKLKGKAFDKAYISNEVTYHEAVISAVKTILIPQTQNEELKQMLIKVTPLLEQHLEMAKMAEAKFK
jgi:putative membrane protein